MRHFILNLPIKYKMMALIMFVISITLLMTTLAFIFREIHNSHHEQYENLSSLAEIIGTNTSAAIIFDDPQSAMDTMNTLKVRSDILAAYVFTKDNTLFIRYVAARKDLSHLPFEQLSPDASVDDYRRILNQLREESSRFFTLWGFSSLVRPILLDGQTIGTVVIHSDMNVFRQRIYGTATVSLLVMVISWIIAYLLSYWLQRVVSTPVLQLTRTMKQVSDSKDFSLRAAKPSSDEIGTLFDGFNEMLGEIEERNQILRQRQAHLQELAHFDSLTRLPNRTLFYDRLNQALHYSERQKEAVAVFFIDLDHFKDVNDTMGHRTGDLLLVEVAQRFLGMVRESDTVARLGGDEFTIFTQNIGSRENACIVAQKIQNIFAVPFKLEGQDIFITASIGITLFPFDGGDVDELLMHADIAMYHAKESGKNIYQLFDKGMNQRASERVSLQYDLRLALERDELQLHYQPKMDIASGRVTGVEALLRWNHPSKGWIPPLKFIPLAEETGIIVPLTSWVLRSACIQAKLWMEAGHRNLHVAVNVSAHLFKRQNVVSTIRNALEKSGIEPSCLEIELTETSLMQDSSRTVEAIDELKRIGIITTIDDFGTGYSSLSYLSRFSIDFLKIDKTFIWNMTKSDNDMAIVKAIIAMANSLNMGVVAEGVETLEQLSLLRGLGCTEIQGYLISKPVNADEVAKYFDKPQQVVASCGE